MKVEVPGRVYTCCAIVEILSSIESELVDEEEEAKRKKRENEIMTDSDIAVSTMVNNIFDEENTKKEGKSVDVESDEELGEEDSLASAKCNDEDDANDNIWLYVCFCLHPS